MNIYLLIILLIVIADFAFIQYLSYRNRKAMTSKMPKELEGIYEKKVYAKQQEYQKKSSQFGFYNRLFSFVVLIVLLLTGAFGFLDLYLREYILNETLLTLSYFGILYVLSEIVSIPFSYYASFVIEEEFGFNKSTKARFWLDQIKSLLLSVVLMGIVLFVVVWIYNGLGTNAWLYAWVVLVGFMLFMTLFYSDLIVPIFNKQTPLEDGELRTAIEEFANEAEFSIKNIYVMDASKRTSKANAYFTGLGAKKRIVLFDTLINELNTEEIVAVLAHEVGHYKKKHTLQMFCLSIIQTGIILYLLSLFLDNKLIAMALGTSFASFHIGLLGFTFLFTPISMLIGIAMNMLSRKNEYQADNYAANKHLANPLVSGLKKLHTQALANLTPDKAYAFVHYSHPTLLDRIKNLMKY